MYHCVQNRFFSTISAFDIIRLNVREFNDFVVLSEYKIHKFVHLTINIFLHFKDIDECAKSPCGLGTCKNIDGSYTCICPKGLSGIHCEIG